MVQQRKDASWRPPFCEFHWQNARERVPSSIGGYRLHYNLVLPDERDQRRLVATDSIPVPRIPNQSYAPNKQVVEQKQKVFDNEGV
jgi:hypothetical protein